MTHHAYLIAGDIEEGIQIAHAFIQKELGLSAPHPDVAVLRYDHFSVEEARAVRETATRAPAVGDAGAIVIVASRIFHEAQNALLKTFEEPAPGTHLFLVVPSGGAVLPTLRSRLVSLSSGVGGASQGEAFLDATQSEREKMVERILARAKKDAPEEKQAARVEALSFARDVLQAAYKRKGKEPALTPLIEDLDRLIPILHERAAPLKQILEHILAVADGA